MLLFGKYYCSKCQSIKNRFQVAYGTDNVRFYWHRCRACGSEVRSLKREIEDVISHINSIKVFAPRK